MKKILMAGAALATLAFGGIAGAQTQAPSANTVNPPANTLPQPILRTPADQTGGAVVPGAATSGGSMTAERARDLIGTDLVGADERKAGEIDNFLVDGGGQIRAAVVEWGGFFGLGQKKAVVPITDLQLGTTERDRGKLNLTREQLEQLPAYDSDKLADYQSRFGWQGLRAVR